MVSAAVRKQRQRTLTLEYEQASRMRLVLQQSQRELRALLNRQPDNWRANALLPQIDQLVADAETRLRQLDPGSLQQTGADMGRELIADAARIPPGQQSFNDWTPIVPIASLLQHRSEYADLIVNVSAELKDRLLRDVQLSQAQGETLGELKQRLLGSGLRDTIAADGSLRRAKNRAETIGRTVVNDLVNRGRLEAYTQGAEEFPELNLRKQWLSSSDHRTSDRCQALAGQIREVGEVFSGDGWQGAAPPSHPNCRSVIVPLAERYTEAMGKLWASQHSRAASEPPPTPKSKKKSKASQRADFDLLKRKGEWLIARAKSNPKLILQGLIGRSKLTFKQAELLDAQIRRENVSETAASRSKNSLSNYFKLIGGNPGIAYLTADGVRPYALPKTGKLNVPNGRQIEVFHEASHLLELKWKDINDAALEFRNRRATGTVRQISELTGNPGYGASEIAVPDHFIDPYAGKVYDGKSATELISMGVESLSSPKRFEALLKGDPEHAAFTLGVVMEAQDRFAQLTT